MASISSRLIFLCLLIAFSSINCSIAKDADVKLQYLKYIPIAGKDPASSIETIPELGWSPNSLAWSPDGKRIAFAAHSKRPFGIVDIETKKITPIASQYRGEGTVHWSSKLNRLILVQGTAVSVFDMNGAEPKLVYSIENKFPKLLNAESSSLVNQGDDDYLVLIGNTNWREEPSNPQIAAYSIKTGERKLSYQIKNPNFDDISNKGSPGTRVYSGAATKNDKNEILVAFAGSVITDYEMSGEAKHLSYKSLRVLKIININQGKIQCNIELQQSKVIDGTNISIVNPKLAALDTAKLILHDKNLLNIYDMLTCKNEYQLEKELHQRYIDHERNSSNPTSSPSWLNGSKPPVSTVYVSPDARWVFGRSAWAPKRSNAPFRVWRVSDWSLVHDGTYEDDGAVDTAAFSQDGNYLAYGSSNRISIYRLNILN